MIIAGDKPRGSGDPLEMEQVTHKRYAADCTELRACCSGLCVQSLDRAPARSLTGPTSQQPFLTDTSAGSKSDHVKELSQTAF